MAHLNTCFGHRLQNAILNHFSGDGKNLIRFGPEQPFDTEEDASIGAKKDDF